MVQKSSSPPNIPSVNGENPSSCFIHFASTPEKRLSPHHSISTELHPSPVRNLASTVSNEQFNNLPLNSSAEVTEPFQHARDTQANKGSLEEKIPQRNKNPKTPIEKTSDEGEEKSHHNTEPSGDTRPTGTSTVPATQQSQARRVLFNSPPQHIPVRRAKSEGHVLGNKAGQAQSAIPAVCTDATMSDRLWSKLEPGSHRDSVSSSSSISSNDTVIDLSLPNLARKSLSILPSPSNICEPPWVNYRHNAQVSCDTGRVSKSKSNPNLEQRVFPKDELMPRPLQPPKDSTENSPGRLTQRRHTWCRLYMEGLKQASTKRPLSAAPASAASMSKSLGDLTSDDISCNFESKYHSISRSFIVKPTRDQFRKSGKQKCRPLSELTEQLRKLTDVEPLNPCDFTPEKEPRDTEPENVEETLVRRTSSRSQSRVRYIANRAKKAQERKRLQGLLQGRSASFTFTESVGTGIAGPIEERGNPEGACCAGQSPCSSLDLLSQLESPSHEESPLNSDSSEFFRLQL